MARGIHSIEGIGPHYAEILKGVGITNIEHLLSAGASSKGREELARKTGVSRKHILRWVNMCDLFRIKGVTGQFAGLLEGSGAATVKELGECNAANLAQKMAAVNKQKHLCRTTPNATIVAGWIVQAKILEPMVTH